MFTLNPTVPVNEGDDDVLDVDVLMKLSTGAQERVQGLKVKLIGKNLTRQDKRFLDPNFGAGLSYYLFIYETKIKV